MMTQHARRLWVAILPGDTTPATNIYGGILRWRAASYADARRLADNDGVPAAATVTRLAAVRGKQRAKQRGKQRGRSRPRSRAKARPTDRLTP